MKSLFVFIRKSGKDVLFLSEREKEKIRGKVNEKKFLITSNEKYLISGFAFSKRFSLFCLINIQ